MNKLQRLEIETKFGHAGAVMVNDDSGNYYKADDADEIIIALQHELDKLQTIVDKLPKTADGVILVTHDEDVWIKCCGQVKTAVEIEWIDKWWAWMGCGCGHPVCDMYSTREAFEAANKESM